MKTIPRLALACVGAGSAIVLAAAPSLAHECVNASKPAAAGVQVILGPSGVEWSTPGLAARIAAGLVNADTGEGFHGLIGFDFDGDGVLDFQTYIVGPDDEIPEMAQFNGPACKGITNVETYFAQCVG